MGRGLIISVVRFEGVGEFWVLSMVFVVVVVVVVVVAFASNLFLEFLKLNIR